MKRSICLILFLLQAFIPLAQTTRITGLHEAMINARYPDERLRYQLALLDEHESLFKDSLQPLAMRTLQEAKALGATEAVRAATIGLVHARLRNDALAAADSLINQLIPEWRAVPEASFAYLKLRLEKANVLASRADYPGAVRELLAVAQAAEKSGNYALLCRALNELGVISYNRNELAQALEYYRKALAYGDRNPRAEQTAAYAYINIGMVHGWQEHYDSALHYLARAKPLCEQLQNLYYLANAYAVEANVYKWSGRLKQAESAMLQMVALREKTEGSITFSNEQLSLANFYVYSNAFDKAIAIYRDGLSYCYARQASGTPVNYELVLHYHEGLAKSYNAIGSRGEYEAALRHIVELKDTLSEQNSAKAIAEMQTRYEVQKKETTIIAQQLDITRKNVLIYGTLMLGFIAILVSWLLFRAYRRRSLRRLESERRQAALAVREAEESERRRIAADLHDSLGSYAASIKSNADEMKRSQLQPMPVLDLLQTNAQQMVSLLADTIWAMRKERLRLSDISDRVKLVLQRLRPNYPGIAMRVDEDLDADTELPPVHAYHLFMIIQEAVNNALRHSGADRIVVRFAEGLEWSVSISDNGRGFSEAGPVTDGGNGLSTMRSRAAAMNCRVEWLPVAPRGIEVTLRPTSN